MDRTMALFTVGMTAVNFLAGPVILLVVGLFVRSALRRKAGVDVPGLSLPRPAARWGCGLLALLPICGFCGLMVATAGGAVHPPLTTVAAPYVCDGTVELQSRNYSYKPGQQGVARNIFCTGPDGERHDITLATIGAATVYYTLILLGVAVVLVVLVRLLIPRRNAEAAPRPAIDLTDLKAAMAHRLRVDADIVRRPASSASPAPPEPSGERVEERLRHLQSLRDGGLISEAEYQAKRAEILGRL